MAGAEAAQAMVRQAGKGGKAELMGLAAESAEEGAREETHGAVATTAWVSTAGGQTEEVGSAEPMEAVTRAEAMCAAEKQEEADSGAVQMVEARAKENAEVLTEEAQVARPAVVGLMAAA